MKIRRVIIFFMFLALSYSGITVAQVSFANAESKKHAKPTEDKKEKKAAEHKKPEKKSEEKKKSKKTHSSLSAEEIGKLREKQRQIRREKIEKEEAERKARGLIIEQDLTDQEMSGQSQPKPEVSQAAPTPTFHTNSAFDAKKRLDEDLTSTGAVDAVLILDSSGSMRRTDPNRLRDQGAKLFSRFLDSKDRVAVYQFDSEPKELLPFTFVSEEQIPIIDKAISTVANDGGYTDIQQAVKHAVDALILNGRPDAIKAVVLLSDGEMDPRPSRGPAKQIIEEMTNTDLLLYRKRQTKLYTLYFSEEADKELLGKIAKTTGGMNWFASSVDEIHKRFSDLFLSMKKPQVVTLDPNGFEMTAGIDEATFYVSRKPEESQKLILADPYGKQYKSDTLPPGTKWYKAEQFDIITVKNPVEGVWSIEGVEVKEGFATLLTNIRLQVQWPEERFKIGDKVRLVARVNQDGKVISEPQIKELLFFNYKIINTENGQVLAEGDLGDRGVDGDQISGDNLYSTLIDLDEEGDFKALVMVRSPTFTRQQVIPFEVSKELITLSIKKLKQEDNKESTEDAFFVELARSSLDLKDLKVELEVKKTGAEEIKSFKMNMVSDNRREYQLPTTALKESGTFQLTAVLKGVDKNKDHKAGRSNIISFVVAEDLVEEGNKDKTLETKKPEEPVGPGIFMREASPTSGIISIVFLVIWMLSFCSYALWSFGKERLESVQALEEYILPVFLVDRLVNIRALSSKVKRQPAKDDLDFFEEYNVIKNESGRIFSDSGSEWVLGEEEIEKSKERQALVDNLKHSQANPSPDTKEDIDLVEEPKLDSIPKEPLEDNSNENSLPEGESVKSDVKDQGENQAELAEAVGKENSNVSVEQNTTEPETEPKDDSERATEQVNEDLKKQE